MISKIVSLFCLVGLARGGSLHGSTLGYNSDLAYPGYGYRGYSSPLAYGGYNPVAYNGYANPAYSGYNGPLAYNGAGYNPLGYAGGYNGLGYNGLGYNGLGYNAGLASGNSGIVAPGVSTIDQHIVHPPSAVKPYVAPYAGYGGYANKYAW